ncbi:MAG: LAGLIDADG family homing endonuclease [Candidatus Micrarchaeia archaeon]
MAEDITLIVDEFERFFDTFCKERLEELFEKYPEKRSLEVDFVELSKYNSRIADTLLTKPDMMIRAAVEALKRMAMPSQYEVPFEPHVRFYNLPEQSRPMIQDIGADHVGNLICVDGLITKRTEIRPKVRIMVLRCPYCEHIEKVPIDRGVVIPETCSSCKRRGLQHDEEESRFVNLQKLEAQEPLERIRGGAQASHIEVWLEDDLVNTVSPGQRVEITGVLRIRPFAEGRGASRTVYSKYLDAVHLRRVEKEFEEVDITKEDERRIVELSKDPAIYQKIIGSIAPSIYGHDEVKEALALQLFGGTPNKRLSDGGMIRSDIHVLLIGDPGISKTRMLQYIANLAPKSIYVSGKAVTSAGLTATAEKDELGDGGWTLKAGALVLASGGVGCIDEFDKVKEEEMAALHEAMESQSYHPETKLMFADGKERRMGEFVEELMRLNPEEVIEGKDCLILKPKGKYRVLTTDFNKIYGVEISQVSKHKAPAYFIRVKLQTGRELLVTPEHPFWVIEDGEIKTVDAEKLREGDFIPMPKYLPIEHEEDEYGKEFYRFLGYHITDGCYELNRHVKNGINFSNKNQELVEDYVGITNEIFGSRCYIQQNGRTGVTNARIVSMPVVRYLSSIDPSLLGKGTSKKLPSQFLSASDEKIKEFLRATYEGDGSFSKNTVSLVCENKEFVEQIQTLLLRFGIRSHIFKDGKVYRITVNGENNLTAFYDKVGFISKEKNSKLLAYLKKKKSYRTTTDVIPNSEKKVCELLRELKIHSSKLLSSSLTPNFSNKYNFTRKSFEKIVRRMNEKICEIKEAVSKVEMAESMEELIKIRKSLNFSQHDIAGGDERLRHLISYYETRNTKIDRCRELLRECCLRKLKVEKEVEKLNRLVESDIRWCKVISVSRVKNKDTEWVYDVTVEPTKTFISECAVLHNTISVAKAGIVAKFKAKTSILAAANPKYGRFDPTRYPAEQFDIPPTILSRFDLIFPIKDILDEEKDRKLASFILDQHVAAGRRVEKTISEEEEVKPPIDTELLRKYIAYSRKKITPVLTPEANEKIKEYYVELRKIGATQGAVPITPRYIEGMVRLAEASAKTRLSNRVELVDAERAIRLMDFMLKSITMDRGLGRIDIDIIATGQPKSKADRIRNVLDIVKELEKEYDLVEIEKVVEEAKKYGLDEATTRKVIDEMLRKTGELYEPKHGHVKVVRPKVE